MKKVATAFSIARIACIGTMPCEILNAGFAEP